MIIWSCSEVAWNNFSAIGGEESEGDAKGGQEDHVNKVCIRDNTDDVGEEAGVVVEETKEVVEKAQDEEQKTSEERWVVVS